MTSRAEDVVLALLDDVDSLETLAREGLPPECIPTEALRPVVAWAIDYFFTSGRLQAPSQQATRDTWGRALDDSEASLGDGTETDTIEWAIDNLKAGYVDVLSQRFAFEFASKVTQADHIDKTAVLAAAAFELSTTSLALQSHANQADLPTGVEEAMRRYQARVAAGLAIWGMTFGLTEVDAFLSGVHDGELVVLAAPAKMGKSFWAARTAFLNAKREATVLFTLENSVEMTYDRIICMCTGIDYNRFQHGQCTPTEILEIDTFRTKAMPEYEGVLYIIQPEPDKTTMLAMIRQAEMLGAKNVIIDQLTFVNHPDPGRKPRYEVIRDLMHELKTLISSGRFKMRVLLMHQINREGAKLAGRTGYLEMDMLAEGSEVERTADFVLGLYQSRENRAATMALLQVLAARRTDIKAWELMWQPTIGLVSVNREKELDS